MFSCLEGFLSAVSPNNCGGSKRKPSVPLCGMRVLPKNLPKVQKSLLRNHGRILHQRIGTA
ncbi:MAG: hypothetical protein OT477_00975 [Chloroflexi bacterium]|nr:hypothetical protein [Chloroflexota bacterium]